jgi:polyhydroxyalkanoate synthase
VPTVEAFVAKAHEIAGSWWTDYKKWLSSLSGAQIPPPQPGGGIFTPLEDAPGSYVRK